MDGYEFILVIKKNPNSVDTINYVDALNNLADRIDNNIFNDVDEFVNIAKVLYNYKMYNHSIMELLKHFIISILNYILLYLIIVLKFINLLN